MSTYEISDSQVSVHLCTFQGYFQKAKVNLRFPSLFFVEWKSMNAKNSVGMIGRKRAVNSQIDLDQSLNFTTQMIYHKGQGKYLKKQSLIHLNLISNSRPDQAKLVGRIALDLSEIANSNAYYQLRTSKLMYCSVEADLTFRVSLVRAIESNLQLNELDRSAFSDLYSFTGPKNGYRPRLEFKDNVSEKRVEEEKKKIKTRLSEKEEVASKNGKAESGKGEKILIQEHEEGENHTANSLPLTEKKKQFRRSESNKILENNKFPEATSPQAPKQQKRPEVQAKLDTQFYKERNLLQVQLSEHKNRIHKLQQDIMAAMKMFEESKGESEVNKTKYLQSEHALNELMQQQKKIKEEYQKQVLALKSSFETQMAKAREENVKEMELMKSGYEADLKILRATLEKQRIKFQQKDGNTKTAFMQEVEQLKTKNQEQRTLIDEMASLQNQIEQLKRQCESLTELNLVLSKEKQSLEADMKNKIQEISACKSENETLRLDLSQLSQYRDQVVDLENKNVEVSAQLEKQRNEKRELELKIEDLTAAFEEKISRIKNEMTARPSIPEQICDIQETKQVEAAIPESQGEVVQKVEPQEGKIEQNGQVKVQVQPKQEKLEYPSNTEELVKLQAKVRELTQIISGQETQLAQYEQMVASQKLEYDMKIESLLQELQVTQSQNQKLVLQIHQNVRQGSISVPFPPVHQDTLKLCQHLKSENSKIAEQLQTLKKSKDEEIDLLAKMTGESQKIKEEVLILEEQKKMNELEIDELKQERVVLRETVEQLKNEKKKREVVGEDGGNIKEEVQDLRVKHKEIVIENEMLRVEIEELKLKLEQAQKNQIEGPEPRSHENQDKPQEKVQEFKPEIIALSQGELPIEETPHPTQYMQTQEVPEAKEQINVADSIGIEMTVEELKDKSVKIQNQNQVIEVAVEFEASPKAVPQQNQESPAKSPSQLEHQSGGSRLNVNLNIEQRLNSQGEPSQRHNYNFDENLTHEQLNKIGHGVNNEDLHTALKEQNIRLKQELDEIKSMKIIEAPQPNKEDETIRIRILEEEKKGLEDALLKMKDQMSKLSQQINAAEDHPLSAPLLAGSSSELPPSGEQIEQYTKALASERQANSLLTARVTDLEQQLAVPLQNDRSYILIRDLEDKVSTLEEEMKIKDDLLAQTQRTMEENYTVKYELADLKEKVNELQVALTERDAYVNELEEVKEYLSKEIEVLQQQKQLKEEEKKEFMFRLEKVENSVDYGKDLIDTKDNLELKNEVEALNGRLVTLNNQNQELKVKISEKQNQKIELQNTIQTLTAKSVEFDSIKTDLESKINGLNDQLKKMQENINTPQQNVVSGQPSQCVRCTEKDQLITEKNAKMSQFQMQIQQLQHQQSEKIQTLEEQLKAAHQPCKVCQDSSDQIQKKDQEISALEMEVAKTRQAYAQVSKKLEQSNLYLAELKIKIEQIPAAKEVKSEMSKLVQNMPHLEVHSIESRSDAQPLNYSREDIPLDELGLRTPAVSCREASSPAVTDRESPLPSPRQSPQEQSLKQQINRLQQEIKNKSKQIASLTFDLSQQSEQKCLYFNEIQRFKEKVADLQSDNKHLKEQGERFAALPLQSFDTNPKFGAGHKVYEVISEDHQERQPSILREVLVRGEVDQTPHRPSPSFDNPMHKAETQTRLQTNFTQMSQQQLDFLKKEMQMMRQELESEKKLHNELQQIHRVCGKKYELLETRYQNCIEQLDYYQIENQDILRNKKGVEAELYALKNQIARHYAEVTQSKDQEKPMEQVNGDRSRQENVLLKAAQTLSGVPLGQPEQAQIPNQDSPTIPEAISPSPSPQQKLLQLQNSERMFREKALLLQQNIENLQKALQQQIQINQANQKLTQKLQTLNELESMAEQFRQEHSEMVKENQELRRVKEEYVNLTGDKGDLTKIIEQHAMWSMERVEWGEKLAKIEQTLAEKQNKFQEEREQLKQQVSQLQEKVLTQSPVPIQEQIPAETENGQKDSLVREQELIKEISSIRAEKLEQLQKVANLQQKLNLIESEKLAKEGEYSDILTQKQNEIEELKFAIEQIQRQLDEHKVYQNHFDHQQENQEQSYKTLQTNYNEITERLLQTNQELEGYAAKVLELEGIISELKQQIKIMEDQNGPGSALDQMSSEVDRLQVEIANKVQYIQELQVKNGQISSTLKDIEQLLQQKEQKEKEIYSVNIQKQRLQLQNVQLSKKVQELGSELKILNQKLSTLQNEKVNLGSTSEQQSKQVQILKGQVSSKTEQLASLQNQYKQKEAQLLALAKEVSDLKRENQHHTLTLSQLSEKEFLLKETLKVVESESKKLIEALKERYKSQEMYYQKYVQKEKECSKMLTISAEMAQEIANKDRSLEHERSQVQKMKNQIQLMLKKGEGELPTDQNVLRIQYQKYEQLMKTNDQLMNKNRQYLQMLSTKSSISIENQRLKSEMKNISSALTQINKQYNEFKTDHEKEVTNLMERLKNTEEKRDCELGKVNQLAKQLQIQREGKEVKQNETYLKVIEEKSQEIQGLRKKIEEYTASILQGTNNIENKRDGRKEEEYKAQIEALQAQVASLRLNLPISKQEIQVSKEPLNQASGGIEKLTMITCDLQDIIQQIRRLFSERSAGSQSLYQAFIQKYDQIEQQFVNLNNETSLIQQKARFISKQLQKIKAHVVKSQSKVYKEKTELLALIRPCENAAGQLVTLSETLSEKDSQSFL